MQADKLDRTAERARKVRQLQEDCLRLGAHRRDVEACGDHIGELFHLRMCLVNGLMRAPRP